MRDDEAGRKSTGILVLFWGTVLLLATAAVAFKTYSAREYKRRVDAAFADPNGPYQVAQRFNATMNGHAWSTPDQVRQLTAAFGPMKMGPTNHQQNGMYNSYAKATFGDVDKLGWGASVDFLDGQCGVWGTSWSNEKPTADVTRRGRLITDAVEATSSVLLTLIILGLILFVPAWESRRTYGGYVAAIPLLGCVVGTFSRRVYADVFLDPAKNRIPWEWPALLAVVLVLTFWPRRRRRDRSTCGKCHYDLTGNTSGICPECGTTAPPQADWGDLTAKLERIER